MYYHDELIISSLKADLLEFLITGQPLPRFWAVRGCNARFDALTEEGQTLILKYYGQAVALEEKLHGSTNLHEKETQETPQQEPPSREDNATAEQHDPTGKARKAIMGVYSCTTEDTRYKPR